jgi:hypothetical protein
VNWLAWVKQRILGAAPAVKQGNNPQRDAWPAPQSVRPSTLPFAGRAPGAAAESLPAQWNNSACAEHAHKNYVIFCRRLG